jgi:Spy/CpxP family protein refolding chaperone
MMRFVTVVALSLLCGSAYAQTTTPNTTGPAPQSDNMQKGGNGDMGKGSMSKSSKKMKHSSKSMKKE